MIGQEGEMSVYLGDPRDNQKTMNQIYKNENNGECSVSLWQTDKSQNDAEYAAVFLSIATQMNMAVDYDDFFYENEECDIKATIEQLKGVTSIEFPDLPALPADRDWYKHDDGHPMWVSNTTYEDKNQIDCGTM